MFRPLVSIMFFALLLVFSQPSSAIAEKRVALVIGNSAYENVSPLINPKNDAEAMSAALERLGFEVIKGIDVTHQQFLKSVRKFARTIQGADVALLFYAGHGLQVGGRNYLALS